MGKRSARRGPPRSMAGRTKTGEGQSQKEAWPAEEGCTKEGYNSQGLEGFKVRSRKSPEHLTDKQQAQLTFIAKSDKRLYRAYLLKEKLRLVFQCADVSTAKAELDGWIKWAQHCRIKVFVELQRKIRRHYDAILATMEYHLSNAVLEATNRKIQLSVYMAMGSGTSTT